MEVKKLTKWYNENFRALPWRQHKDPYPIWISETMLQQTTSVGVLPFYEKFLAKFPRLDDLAKAPLEEVLEAWAGLGYYSRARNLHKCAKALVELKNFPQTWSKLIELPGIGPYTSRAISSLAFEEAVGVLDGNVIRILSRYYELPLEWWKTKERQQLQGLADKAAQQDQSSIVNQAMMELGATVCRPQNPFCHLCPVAKKCKSRINNTQSQLPLKKPKKTNELWQWNAQLHFKKNKVALIKNNYLPFLKGQWIFPGSALKKKSAPKKFHVKHNITHHEIFVKVSRTEPLSNLDKNIKWVSLSELPKHNPSSLLQKALNHFGLKIQRL